MKELEELEFKRILNEVIFLTEDLSVKKEMSLKLEYEFHKEVNDIVSRDQGLKKKWDEVQEKQGNENLRKAEQYEEQMKRDEADETTTVGEFLDTEDEVTEDYNEDNEESNDSENSEDKEEKSVEDIERETEADEKKQSLKKLYREIVKHTHPDIVDDKDKNIIYKEATKAYDENNIMALIYFAHKLGLKYDADLINLKELRTKVKRMKDSINMYEMSLPFKWYYNNKDTNMMKMYISHQILSSVNS